MEKIKSKLKKQGKKNVQEKERAHDEVTVEIDMDTVFSAPHESTSGGKTRSTFVEPQDDESDSPSDANSEVEEQETIMNSKGKGKERAMKAFGQRDLVALAFAGDNVVKVKRFYTSY